jgi:hypothetical protein
MQASCSRIVALVVGIALLALGSWVSAEPPSRAARLSYIEGTVSFSPAGENEWLRAVINRPLTSGDRLWVGRGSRAELQLGGASLRLGGGTSISLLNLDDSILQVQLEQGSMKVRVRRMGGNEAFEINTPNLAFTITRPGDYRVEADEDTDSTTVLVHSGRAAVYGARGSYAVAAGQGYRSTAPEGLMR